MGQHVMTKHTWRWFRETILFDFSASNGVVLATEKKQKSILYDEQSVHKVEPITKHIGMVYSGMGPDYRWAFLEFWNKQSSFLFISSDQSNVSVCCTLGFEEIINGF